ncbi:MAG: biotin/lipoyl-containing protein [Candidatus Thorarchaeota archaeon]
MTRKYELKINETMVNVEVDGPHDGTLNVTIGEVSFPVRFVDGDQATGKFKVMVGDIEHTFRITPQVDSKDYMITIHKQNYRVQLNPLSSALPRNFRPETTYRKVETTASVTSVETQTEPGTVTAPLPGRVLEVRVKEGKNIKNGDVLLVLEAMKMANEIRAPQQGTIKTVHVNAGDTVEKGQPMITIQ